MPSHSDYLVTAILNQHQMIEDARQYLPHPASYDGFVGTGLSGQLVVPLFAYIFDKRFAVIRKNPGNSHSCLKVESGLENGDRFLFVDDIVASGRTRDSTVSLMEDRHEHPGIYEWVGTYLYGTRAARAVFYPKDERQPVGY